MGEKNEADVGREFCLVNSAIQAVGKSEPKLLERVNGTDQTHRPGICS